MDTQVTQKKTLKLRKPDAVSEEDAPDQDVVMASMKSRPAAAAKGGGGSYVLPAILTIISFGLFVALVVVQWMEWSFYHRPPSAFPL